MQVEQVADPAELVRRAAPLCAADPVLTNLPLTIAQSAADGRRYAEQWWWLVVADSGEVVGCAVRTPPWNLVVSPMPDEAAAALAGAVAAADRGLPGVNGPEATVHAFIDALGRSSRVTMNDLVLVLGELVVPEGVPGSLETATLEELDMLVAWNEQFAADAGVPARNLPESITARIEQGAMLWWTVDGERVAMAAHTPPLSTPAGPVARIGPVFTPAEHRRRGFGAAVTAGVAQLLLPRCAVVMLFADAANPTSNGVYERIGFRPVTRMVETSLDDARVTSTGT